MTLDKIYENPDEPQDRNEPPEVTQSEPQMVDVYKQWLKANFKKD